MKILLTNLLGFTLAAAASMYFGADVHKELAHLFALSMGAICYWGTAKYIWKKDL